MGWKDGMKCEEKRKGETKLLASVNQMERTQNIQINRIRNQYMDKKANYVKRFDKHFESIFFFFHL